MVLLHISSLVSLCIVIHCYLAPARKHIFYSDTRVSLVLSADSTVNIITIGHGGFLQGLGKVRLV